MNRMASVSFPDGQEIDVPSRYVEPTPPKKNDKVMGYRGVCYLCDVS